MKSRVQPILRLAAVCLVVMIVISPFPAQAVLDQVAKAFSGILYTLFVYVPGWILALLSNVLVWVLSYDGFGRETIVDRGWVILRDLSNMFFIIIMLVIAIGTILKSPKYGYQNNLRRLLLMAILINFSKTIALFFIDFSQAITIAFANAFLSSIQAGIPQLLGITGILSLNEAPQVDGGTVLVQIFMSAIMIIIACVVVGVICVLLLFRIIYLQFLVMLSPLAFLASTWEKGFTYYQRWWDQLGNYLALGPVLTFFLWLSFSAVQYGAMDCTPASNPDCPKGTISTLGGEATNLFDARGNPILPGGGATSINIENSTESEHLADALKRYFVGIMLLMGSLFMAQELGTAGAGIARNAVGKISAVGRSIARAPVKGAGMAGRYVWSGSTGEGGIKEGLSRASSGLAGGIAGRLAPMQQNLQDRGFLMRNTFGRVVGAASGGLRSVTQAESQRRDRKVSKEMEGLKGASTEQLRLLQTDINRDKALAATRMLAKRKDGFGDFKQIDPAATYEERVKIREHNNAVVSHRRQAMDNFRRGGEDTKEEYEKFQLENWSYITDASERREVLSRAARNGDQDKIIRNLDPDYFNSLDESERKILTEETRNAGYDNDHWEKGMKGWSKEQQKQAARSYAAAYDYDTRSLGVYQRLNPGAFAEFATEAIKKARNPDANATQEELDAIKHLAQNVRQAVSGMSGENLAKIDVDHLQVLMPELNPAQIKNLGEKGNDEHRKVILQNIDTSDKNEALAKNLKLIFDSESFVKSLADLKKGNEPRYSELVNLYGEMKSNKEKYDSELATYRQHAIEKGKDEYKKGGQPPEEPPKPKSPFM